MQLRRATEDDRPVLAALAADEQIRPDRHVSYLGVDPDSIAAEIVDEDEDWTAVSSVVVGSAGQPVGWMMGSVDADMGRVWWYGPFVDVTDDDWSSAADVLYDRARALLPDVVDEEELAPDRRHELLIGWGTGRGFEIDPGSAVLSLAGEPARPAASDHALAIRPVDAPDRDPVAALHDELFPGTHTSGAALAADADRRRIRLVAECDGTFAGYVAAEMQPDGQGYIDFVGVAANWRRRGFGTELVLAAVTALRERGASGVHLTVREANLAARTLYTRLGFVEERIVVPLRRGFRLP